MVAVLADAATLAVDPAWIARIKAGLVRVSFLQSEAILGMVDPSRNDKTRLKFYNQVVQNPDLYGPMFAWTMAAYIFVESTNTDAEIETFLVTFIDMFAGIAV